MPETYLDLDTETWNRLSDYLRAEAAPGECRIETLSRLMEGGRLGANLIVFDQVEYQHSIEALELAMEDAARRRALYDS